MGMHENELYDQISHISRSMHSDLITPIEQGVSIYKEYGSNLYHDDGETLSKYPNDTNENLNKNMAQLKGVVFHNEGGHVRIIGKEHREISDFIKALILITKARGIQ